MASNKALDNKKGLRFTPKNEKDRGNYELLKFLRQKELITDQIMEATLAEYKISNEAVGIILVRNGFITHKAYVESLIEFNPENIVHEEMFSTKFDQQRLMDLSTMLVAETGKSVYMATLESEDLVRSAFLDNEQGKEIIFVPAVPEKINSYLDKLNYMLNGESGLVDTLLRQALSELVSDVHILPRHNSYSVFFRYMGVKHLAHEGPLDEYYSLAARIKDRSRMDLAERRIPQDGGFQVENNGRLIDMRVATLPTPDGQENIVIRLLDPDRIQPSLNLLGITRVDQWRMGVSRPEGVCLICGPTGSGKTTTLNASVREMNRFEKAIYTVEDPVEYRIPYVGQININQPVGLDFARSIRAFMRADPDIIIVGEIRDVETARNAIKAAETGHLVLGTLHTSTIRGAIDRLRDIGVSADEMRYILRTVLVQRLVRTLCPSCKGEGCDDCFQSGYGGRTIVSECNYFPSVKEVDALIDGEITWPTMAEDAVLKIKEGVTDIKEVYRVFGEEAVPHLIREGFIESKEDLPYV